MKEDRTASDAEALDALLWAMSIELKATAAIGRALMQGLAASSDEAAAAMDKALEKEALRASSHDLRGQQALRGLIDDVRRRLRKDAA